jgi:hypothetical protein
MKRAGELWRSRGCDMAAQAALITGFFEFAA